MSTVTEPVEFQGCGHCRAAARRSLGIDVGRLLRIDRPINGADTSFSA
jgi:hypothetical protein